MVAVIAGELKAADAAEEVSVFHKTLNIHRTKTIASIFSKIFKKNFRAKWKRKCGWHGDCCRKIIEKIACAPRLACYVPILKHETLASKF